MGNLEFDTRISLGSILNLCLVACAVITLILQQWALHDASARDQQLQKDAVSALGQRVGDLSDRIQALSLGNTQRFSTLDTSVTELSKRVDTLSINIQSISDRLVIQEAKAQALQDEMKIVSQPKGIK